MLIPLKKLIIFYVGKFLIILIFSSYALDDDAVMSNEVVHETGVLDNSLCM